MSSALDREMAGAPSRPEFGGVRLGKGSAPLRNQGGANAAEEGSADIVVEQNGPRTRIAHLYQRQPLRVLAPRAAEGDPLTLVLVNTSGGVVGGDRLRCELTVCPGAACLLTAQSAEKIYRSAGQRAEIEHRVSALDGAWVEFLPQGTIVFDGACLRRTTRLAVHDSARMLAGEIVVLGRIASGESVSRCSLRDRWEVHRDGRLAWCDALRLEGWIDRPAAAAAGLGGARAFAICVYAAPDAAMRIELARAIQEGENADTQIRCGATIVNNVLVLRWLGEDARAVRHSLGRFWGAWRAAIAGLPPRLPRIWAI